MKASQRLGQPTASLRSSCNPYVFLVGCPRSGTTLLKRLVNAHPQIAITRETHWIPRFHKKRWGITPEGRVTPDLIERLLDYHRFSLLGITREDLFAMLGNDYPSYSDFVSGVFDLYAFRESKLWAGDKTPGYVRHIELLHELWPQARFVHIIRDGRDVCLSVLNWAKTARNVGRLPSWDQDPVSTTALWWSNNVESGREAGRRLSPDLYLELNYEALCRDPQGQCRNLCDFLNLPYDPAMLQYHQDRVRSGPGLSAKKAILPPTPGLRDWRSQMTDDALERFEAMAGEILIELGYEAGRGHLSAIAKEHARKVRDLCEANSGSRKNYEVGPAA